MQQLQLFRFCIFKIIQKLYVNQAKVKFEYNIATLFYLILWRKQPNHFYRQLDGISHDLKILKNGYNDVRIIYKAVKKIEEAVKNSEEGFLKSYSQIKFELY